MDPLSLAAAAVPLIASFLKRVGKRVAGSASADLEDAAVERLERLYQSIRTRLSGDSYAEGALKRLEEQPDNENRQTTVAEVVAEAAQEDTAFAEALARLTEEAKGVTGNLDIDDLEGRAAVMKARLVTGNVSAGANVHTVHQGAELIGIEADEIRG